MHIACLLFLSHSAVCGNVYHGVDQPLAATMDTSATSHDVTKMMTHEFRDLYCMRHLLNSLGPIADISAQFAVHGSDDIEKDAPFIAPVQVVECG